MPTIEVDHRAPANRDRRPYRRQPDPTNQENVPWHM